MQAINGENPQEFLYSKAKLVEVFLKMSGIEHTDGMTIEPNFHQDKYGLMTPEIGQSVQCLSCVIKKSISDNPDIQVEFTVSINLSHLLKSILVKDFTFPSKNFEWYGFNVIRVIDVGNSVAGVVV